jgi:hypothetical protein
MNLKNLQSLFSDNGCQKIYVKKLSPNDNSKNQVYLGGSFEILNILPLSAIKTESPGDWKRERFKASINFKWIGSDGNLYPAPQSQLILYPKYPEVRFSGFLAKCENPPSDLMTQRLENRLFFLAVAGNGTVLGYVASPFSIIAKEFNVIKTINDLGVFKVIELPETSNNRQKLINELRRIYLLNWINSKSLTKNGIVPCISSQCGGYTLEAELGIIRNGFAEPDYLGWEIKNFGVKRLENLNSSRITLFTPEPTGGFYINNGIEAFIRKFGYSDLRGREDRINFGGVHKVGIVQRRTMLKMELIGFDRDEGKIRSTNGRIALLDDNEMEAASWSFASLLLHWNRKHNQACYVPSLSELEPEKRYRYGNKIILGNGTDFQLFLTEMAKGNIFYDPGIKLESASVKPKTKKRSQFRMQSIHLKNLYKATEIVEL